MSLEIVKLEDQQAGTTARVLPGFGMNCYSFEVPTPRGPFDLLWAAEGFDTGKERASSSGIPMLFPFVGRLRGTKFEHEGKTYEFPAGDGIGNAIHGLVIDRPWKVIEQTPQSVSAEVQPSTNAPELQGRWPADYRVTATYALDGMLLRLTIKVENTDEHALPFGFGTHPYFRVPSEGDWSVTVPAATYWPLEAMLPTGEETPVDASRDLCNGRPFADTKLDDVLGDLSFENHLCVTKLENQKTNERIVQSFDDQFRECVVYTPPHREAICIEPYTCVPSAAELGTRGVNAGWQTLAPGQQWQSTIDIAYQPER